jgi:alpha-D-xyloside xylohydrolase
VFCPILRLHGHREPRDDFGANHSGGPNELWSFGDEAYKILTAQLQLRERLKPYLLRQMELAADSGLPAMRPLFVDFPADDRAWTVEDQFMLGPDLLVAPVLSPGPGTRLVYLPTGTTWIEPVGGARIEGGREVECGTQLDRIPVFSRAGADVLKVWQHPA